MTIPESAVLPDGSIDPGKLPAAERVRYRLSQDLLATQLLGQVPVDEAERIQFFLASAGLGPKATEVVAAFFQHPELPVAVLEFIQKWKQEQVQASGDGGD